MTRNDLDPARSAEMLFGDILDYVEKADALVTARDTVTLAGLDISINSLCQRITDLAPDQAKEYEPELNHLMDRINALHDKMVALQAEVASTIKSLGKQKKASHAYGNAPTGRTEE